MSTSHEPSESDISELGRHSKLALNFQQTTDLSIKGPICKPPIPLSTLASQYTSDPLEVTWFDECGHDDLGVATQPSVEINSLISPMEKEYPNQSHNVVNDVQGHRGKSPGIEERVPPGFPWLILSDNFAANHHLIQAENKTTDLNPSPENCDLIDPNSIVRSTSREFKPKINQNLFKAAYDHGHDQHGDGNPHCQNQYKDVDHGQVVTERSLLSSEENSLVYSPSEIHHDATNESRYSYLPESQPMHHVEMAKEETMKHSVECQPKPKAESTPPPQQEQNQAYSSNRNTVLNDHLLINRQSALDHSLSTIHSPSTPITNETCLMHDSTSTSRRKTNPPTRSIELSNHLALATRHTQHQTELLGSANHLSSSRASTSTKDSAGKPLSHHISATSSKNSPSHRTSSRPVEPAPNELDLAMARWPYYWFPGTPYSEVIPFQNGHVIYESGPVLGATILDETHRAWINPDKCRLSINCSKPIFLQFDLSMFRVQQACLGDYLRTTCPNTYTLTNPKLMSMFIDTMMRDEPWKWSGLELPSEDSKWSFEWHQSQINHPTATPGRRRLATHDLAHFDAQSREPSEIKSRVPVTKMPWLESDHVVQTRSRRAKTEDENPISINCGAEDRVNNEDYDEAITTNNVDKIHGNHLILSSQLARNETSHYSSSIKASKHSYTKDPTYYLPSLSTHRTKRKSSFDQLQELDSASNRDIIQTTEANVHFDSHGLNLRRTRSATLRRSSRRYSTRDLPIHSLGDQSNLKKSTVLSTTDHIEALAKSSIEDIKSKPITDLGSPPASSCTLSWHLEDHSNQLDSIELVEKKTYPRMSRRSAKLAREKIYPSSNALSQDQRQLVSLQPDYSSDSEEPTIHSPITQFNESSSTYEPLEEDDKNMNDKTVDLNPQLAQKKSEKTLINQDDWEEPKNVQDYSPLLRVKRRRYQTYTGQPVRKRRRPTRKMEPTPWKEMLINDDHSFEPKTTSPSSTLSLSPVSSHQQLIRSSSLDDQDTDNYHVQYPLLSNANHHSLSHIPHQESLIFHQDPLSKRHFGTSKEVMPTVGTSDDITHSKTIQGQDIEIQAPQGHVQCRDLETKISSSNVILD